MLNIDKIWIVAIEFFTSDYKINFLKKLEYYKKKNHKNIISFYSSSLFDQNRSLNFSQSLNFYFFLSAKKYFFTCEKKIMFTFNDFN